MRPLNVTTQAAYSIGVDQSGHRRFVTTMTDPNGNVTTQYADYGGRKVQVTDSIDGTVRTTLMHYDNLGQLDSVSDPEGFKTTYSYDMLGRMTKRIHPDAGETRYTYDNAGNLTKEINPLGQIFYDYTYYRLLKKRYSSMTGNDVTYTYGTGGTETGRPVRIVDGSGMYECRYDALGNVTDETRTIALPNHNEVYRFRTSYQYDSWGRMLSMTYPDGEEVAYTYLWGGDLYSMHGTKGANHRVYVSKILYNTFGQRSQVEYGNRTKAYYTYDALHRLVKLKSRNGSGTLMQDISYTFDSASNVTGITNTAGIVNSLGGGYANSYRYDALHRLVWSSGGGAMGSYSMDMGYTPSGRIGEKNRLTHLGTFSETVETIYGYRDTYQPHAVRRIYDRAKGIHHDLRWDGAGNLGQISVANEDALFESGRFLFWTEDSRMHAAVDEKYYSYYTYDHGGERRLKLTGENHLVDVNANYMSTYSALSRPTLYPSAYMVVNSKGYTKHYYAGAERVAARIGGGGLDALISLADGGDSLRTKASHLFTQSIGQVNNRVLENNEPDCITGSVAEQDELKVWIEGIPEQLQASTLIDYGEFTDVIQSLRADHNGGQEREVYFYHSDHLGSASWITDSGGQAIQHLQYLPYGEPYINQRTSGYNERFTFTGKERDSETGFGYFGARYMDYELMTMWLSVDPMADKYPSISPYAYCAWNPVKLVDPDGNEIHISIPISLKDGVKIVDYYYHYDFKSHKSSWMDREGNALNYDNISVDVAAEFVEELTSSLELLLSKPVGKWLVGTIMRDDKKDILIGQSPYNFANENGEGIGFNPTRKSKIETNGCKTNPAFIGLGHELAHIFDNWYGDFQKTCKEVWFRYPESYNVSVEFTSNAEKYACMIENLLRFEHNLDQREYYFSHKNSNMGKCITF